MADVKQQGLSPWAVRGVPTEARTAASMASKRLGIPLGAWVGRTLLEAAMAELKPSARQEVGPTEAQMMAQIVETMEAMKAGVEAQGKRLEEIAAKVEQPPAPVEQPVQQLPARRGLFGLFKGPG